MSCLILGAQKWRFYSSFLWKSLQVQFLPCQLILYSIKLVLRQNGSIFATATYVSKVEFIVTTTLCVIFLLYLDDLTLCYDYA